MDRAEELALLIKAAQRDGERRVNELLRPLGLTAAQAEVLSVLAATGPVSLGDLGGLLVAEGGNPSRLVDRMVSSGLVERRGQENDRRRVELTLTARGRKLARQATAAKTTMRSAVEAVLDDEDFERLRIVLEAYLGDGPLSDVVRQRRRLADGAGRTA